MMRLLSLWPWGLGLLAVAAVVGIVLSPVAALKLAKEIGQFVLEKARALVKRMREVENWWQVASVALAVVCIGFAFSASDAKRQVVLITEQCETRVHTIETQVTAARTEARTAAGVAADNRTALLSCKAQLADEVGQRQRVEQLNREAVASARSDAAQAREDLADWQATYRQRPPTCQAALKALEAACPTLTDY